MSWRAKADDSVKVVVEAKGGLVSWHRPRRRDTKHSTPRRCWLSADFHFELFLEGSFSFDATSRVVP
jgi:hypothetical protein